MKRPLTRILHAYIALYSLGLVVMMLGATALVGEAAEALATKHGVSLLGAQFGFVVARVITLAAVVGVSLGRVWGLKVALADLFFAVLSTVPLLGEFAELGMMESLLRWG